MRRENRPAGQQTRRGNRGVNMKIAVFSDIHGNLTALKKVLELIKEKEPDRTIFLGDIFQRGNEEIECLELLMESNISIPIRRLISTAFDSLS